MTNETPAQRLGRLVRARRKELRQTQTDIQNAGGPSTATLRLIEGGKHTEFRDGTGAALEAALRWDVGSIDRILAGGEPIDTRRPISVHMLEDDPADEIARTTTAAMERVGRDGKAEVDRQVQLLNGVREAWKLAPLAAKLGCNPSEIRDFTHAGFGLLMGSGVLGLIATYKDELAKVVAEFTEADKWGPNPPRPQIDLAFLPHQTNEEDSDDLETATQSPASSEGDEIEEDPPGSRPGVVKQLRSTELFGQFDAEMDELFARAARIDPALDMTAEVDQLRDTYARIRDTPIGNREYARAMLALLRRLQGSANPELAAGINSMIEEAEQYANSAHIAAGAASKVVRPAHWDDDDAVPDWENDASLAARDVPDEPKDDSQ